MSAMTAPAAILDPNGQEEPATVFLDHLDGDETTASICVSHRVDLGIEQARAVARRILELADAVQRGVASTDTP